VGLLEEVIAGSPSALARAISVVEDRRDGCRELLSRCHRRERQGFRIGLTGPPGAGKSTLGSRLALAFDKAGDSVGVIAVDPTSPFTGGALLGDRVRMNELSGRTGVFVRSMATRGASGGLAAATADAALVLDAASKRWILIETVGVGQVELDVAETADVVVVVLTPESGDGVQTLKAGLIEVADIFVVNKADRPAADRMHQNLRTTLELRPSGSPEIPIISTVAVSGEGIEELISAIREHKNKLTDPERAKRHRVRMARSHVVRLVEARVKSRLSSADELLETLAQRVARLEIDPYEAADQVIAAGAVDLLSKMRKRKPKAIPAKSDG
jgi:LAO/AO transport system kinase